MRGPAKLASYLGILMVLTGFAAVGLAWNGAAGTGYLPAQFPFLLSGGLGGLGLISAGAGVLFVQAQREIDAEEAAYTQRAIDAILHTAAALRGGAPPAAAARATSGRRGGTAVLPRPAAAPEPVSTEAWAPPAEEEALVVVGKSSFHDPSCHLVSSRDDLDLMGRDDALASGLKPCRVCKP